MSARSILWYLLSLVCLIVAGYFLVRSFDWRSVISLIFAMAAILLFWQGSKASKKQ